MFIILKIFGYILLFIILFLILTVLFLLLSKIKYTVSGYYKKDKKYAVGVKIDYLCKIISIRIIYKEDIKVEVKLFKKNILNKKSKKTSKIQPEEFKSEVGFDEDILKYKTEFLDNEKRSDISLNKAQPINKKVVKSKTTHIEDNKNIENSKNKKNDEKDKTKHSSIVGKIENIIDKIYKYNTPNNHKILRKAYKRLRKIVLHIFYTDVKLEGQLGFEDVELTAKIYGILCALNSEKIHINILPNFDESILETKFKIKGYLRLGYILYQGIRIILIKGMISFIKNVKRENGQGNK